MTSKTTSHINCVDNDKRLPNYPHKDEAHNSTNNPYWPKALVTTFMMNRNKVTSIVPSKRKLFSSAHI